MIRNVENISRARFISLNKDISINPFTHCYISISGYDENPILIREINHSLWHSGIMLKFNDTLKSNYCSMNQEHANIIRNFCQSIQELEHSMTIIVHCSAGISRSAGIAKWINDYYNLHIKKYQEPDFYHNDFVYGLLANNE